MEKIVHNFPKTIWCISLPRRQPKLRIERRKLKTRGEDKKLHQRARNAASIWGRLNLLCLHFTAWNELGEASLTRKIWMPRAGNTCFYLLKSVKVKGAVKNIQLAFLEGHKIQYSIYAFLDKSILLQKLVASICVFHGVIPLSASMLLDIWARLLWVMEGGRISMQMLHSGK